MKEIKRASDLIPDRHNANQSTVRGTAAIAESLSRYGAGRSILVDRNGKIIAGNGTTEGFVGNGNDEVVVVQSDGRKLVVVQRVDLDLDTDAAARELAHADNRTNQLGYMPDVNKIEADMLSGADLGWLWRADEIEALKGITPKDDGEGDLDFDKMPRNPGYELVVVFNSEAEMREGRKAIQDLGYYTK